MTDTLTVKVDSEALRLAQIQAHERHTTVPDALRQYVEAMAQNQRDREANKTPITDSLRGSIQAPKRFDERAALEDELGRKYGR